MISSNTVIFRGWGCWYNWGRIFSNTIKLMLERQKSALYQQEMLLESVKITLYQQDMPHQQDMLIERQKSALYQQDILMPSLMIIYGLNTSHCLQSRLVSCNVVCPLVSQLVS